MLNGFYQWGQNRTPTPVAYPLQGWEERSGGVVHRSMLPNKIHSM